MRDLVDHGGEPERAAAAGRARDREIAAHGPGDPLDEGEPEPGAAVAARDRRVRLRERPKQSLAPRPALSPMPLSVTVKTSRTLAARGRLAASPSRRTLPRSVNFTALSIRFSSAAAQAQRIADHGFGQLVGNVDGVRRVLWLCGARRERRRQRLGQPARPESARGAARRPLLSARTASTISDVSIARCSAVPLIAIAQPRSRSPSSEVANSSPSARMPVSGVRISWAMSASVASTARVRAAGVRRARRRRA